jgi:hypothetical protein
MEFAVDGISHYTYEPSVYNSSTWPFYEPQYLILNIAIQPSIAANFTQSAMDIDYIRVFQEKATGLDAVNHKPRFNFFPNPVSDQINIDLLNNFNENTTVIITNLLGKVVYTHDVFVNGSNLQLNHLTHLNSGLYLLTFALNNRIHQFKFIKN